MRSFTFSLPIALLSFCLTTVVSADSPSNWSRFHGNNGLGYSADGDLPNRWSAADYDWTAELKGRDVGSPSVFGDKVFLLDSNSSDQKMFVRALDASTGKLIWERPYLHPSHHLHKRNTYASSTPTVDREFVFVAWSNPEATYLKCLDHDGKEVWSRNFGTWQSQHGFGTSPRIVDSMVVLLNSQQAEQLDPDQKPGQSRMIAVDRGTGKTVWDQALETTRVCYGVPAVKVATDGSKQIIGANTGNGLFALDSRTGKPIWSLKVFEKRCCSTPLVIGDVAIGSSGSGGGGNHLVAVKIPKKGESPKQLYRIDRGAPYVPTPAVKDGHLYMVDDRGIASCVVAESGRRFGKSASAGNTALLR